MTATNGKRNEVTAVNRPTVYRVHAHSLDCSTSIIVPFCRCLKSHEWMLASDPTDSCSTSSAIVS